MRRKRTVKSESLFLNGIEFRRYPDAKQWSDRVYYKPSGTYAARGIRAYHHELWKSLHGEIPTGFHVHHRDNNPLNNDPSNLELVEGHAHQSKHGEKTKSSEFKSARSKHLNAIRPLTVEWHRSPEGHAWHKQHGIEGMKNRKPSPYTCEHCGKPFESLASHGKVKFCSNNCKSAARRKSHIDDVTRACAYCGKEFHCDKYADTRYCSISCARYGSV